MGVQLLRQFYLRTIRVVCGASSLITNTPAAIIRAHPDKTKVMLNPKLSATTPQMGGPKKPPNPIDASRKEAPTDAS